MKWKTIERIIANTAAVITIFSGAIWIVNKCSYSTSGTQSSETIKTGEASYNDEINRDDSSVSLTGEKESFVEKWKTRKTRFEEEEEKGFLSMMLFLVSYFPGLNILFVLVLFGLALAGHINNRNKGFAEDTEGFWLGFFAVFLMFIPFFWMFIFAILK